MAPASTGFSAADSRDDFDRVRRQAQWARLGRRLRGRSADLDLMLPLDEVLAALGRRGERRRGLVDAPLDAIIGSVDRTRGFDRSFRPTSHTSRTRFERLAAAARRGEDLPPIDLVQVGDAYFVVDGHHRVAVARALQREVIASHVTEILTVVGAGRDLTVADLPVKGHERLFRERVPLTPEHAATIVLDDPDDYAQLAEGVEAWGFRVAQQDATTGQDVLPTRAEVAELWWATLYDPVCTLLRDAGLLPDIAGSSDAEAYLRLSALRYRLLRTQRWDEEIIAELRAELAAGRRA